MKAMLLATFVGISLLAGGVGSLAAEPAGSATPTPVPLAKDDIVKMTRAGLPDEVIIQKIQDSQSVFHLEVADMIALKKAGVSARVLEAMVSTEFNSPNGGQPRLPPTPARTSSGVTLEKAEALVADKKCMKASDALFELIELHELSAGDLPVAEQHLGDCLYGMALHQSALYYYEDAVEDGGPRSPAFAASLARMIELSDRLHDARRLLAEFQDIQPATIPPDVRRDAGYFYGQLYFRKDDPENALRALESVDERSPYYGRALFTEGVLLTVLEGKDDDAIAAFRRAIGACADRPELCDQARLAVGRTLYGAERYSEAISAYREVPRNGPLGNRVAFENAWALYKNGELAKALVAVRNLRSSPGFYEPEGWILEATIFFRLGLYAETEASLSEFFLTYSPVSAKMRAFERQAERRPPEEVCDYLQDLARPAQGGTFMPSDLMAEVAGRGAIRDVLFHLHAIDEESGRIRGMKPWRDSSVALAILDQLQSHKNALRKLGGKLILREMEEREEELDVLFAMAKTINVEVTRAEQLKTETVGGRASPGIYLPDDEYDASPR